MESAVHVTESTISESPPGDGDGSSGQINGPPGQINGPPGQTFNMEAAFLKMSGEMGQMTTLLGRICEHLPITDARGSYGPPGSHAEGRKRRHSASSGADSEDGSPNRRTSKDDFNAISVTASEDEVNNLLGLNVTEPAEPGAAAVPNDELLTELSAVLTDEAKTGPKVTQQLADIVNKRWDNKLVPDKINKILEKYAQPENCSEVTVTRVNSGIWARADTGQRKTDLRLANMQQALQKATFATVLTTDQLVAIKNDPKSAPPHLNEMITNNIDAIALLGHIAHELSQFRREKLKPALKPEYHALCSPEANIASTNTCLAMISPNRYRMQTKPTALEMLLGRPRTVDPFGETPPGNRNTAVMPTEVALAQHTDSLFWGKGPNQTSGRNTTTVRKRAKRNNATSGTTQNFGK